jgi:hypothetical protein
MVAESDERVPGAATGCLLRARDSVLHAALQAVYDPPMLCAAGVGLEVHGF